MFRDVNLRRRYLAAGSSNHVHQTNQNVAGKAGHEPEAGIASVLASSQRSCQTAEFEVLTMSQQWSLMAAEHSRWLARCRPLNSSSSPLCTETRVPKDIKGELILCRRDPRRVQGTPDITPNDDEENIPNMALLADSARRMAASWRSWDTADVAPKRGRKHSHKRHLGASCQEAEPRKVASKPLASCMQLTVRSKKSS